MVSLAGGADIFVWVVSHWCGFSRTRSGHLHLNRELAVSFFRLEKRIFIGRNAPEHQTGLQRGFSGAVSVCVGVCCGPTLLYKVFWLLSVHY